MNVKFLNPFVEAACEVIKVETSITMERGELTLDKEPYVTDDIMVIISLVGRVVGNVIFGMSKETALALASKIMGEPFSDFNNLAQSGIAELGNVITGKASVKLTEAGYESVISPPTMLQGKGATISTLDIARLVVPFTSEVGTVAIHLALREGSQKAFSAAETPVAQSMS
ncbi:MAG: chemotaxis protein CheX [Anaerolineales bacterium]|nr:chemotaxis protein CheX [Anaerolineales bacterium]